MSAGSDGADADERRRDAATVEGTHNTARYFAENRQVAWVALVATVLFGIYGYARMPKAKDPTVEVRVAVAICPWLGADATDVEQLVTRKIEQKIAENASIEKIESISRTGVSVVYVTLKDDVLDRKRELDDLQGRLDTIRDLPDGAGPIRFQKDFGDTATLMLTVASPKVSDIELRLRARSLQSAIEAVREGADTPSQRATLVVSFPPSINASALRRLAGAVRNHFESLPETRDVRLIESPGFLGVDAATLLDDATILESTRAFAAQQLSLTELHPDVWRPPAIVRDPRFALLHLRNVAGDRYSYRELDEMTETIQRYLLAVPIVSKVSRIGVLPEQILLEYSQERLASYGFAQASLTDLLSARNITAPGGVIEVGGKNVIVDPSGEFESEEQIGNVVASVSAGGLPVYLRDLVDVSREYQSPARFLSFHTSRDDKGQLARTRAITLAVNMRPGAQIGEFSEQVDDRLALVTKLLPDDLILARTSDQPRQVAENVELFMSSLYEAIVLVVIVALIGFWEWRTALLLALSIPITLAMTFGMMHAFSIDLQQISIASLIIALGLLVDDPVVASDAIKRSLADGWRPTIAAWLGPTKLARAILFATITNIAAYLPFLTLPGDTGKFIYSLPVVLTLSLVASRIVSMTFVPLLGVVLLRATAREPTAAERRSRPFGRMYIRAGRFAIEHRRAVFAASLVLLVAGFAVGSRVRSAFFPKDLSYLSYVDVWLPEDAPLSATRAKSLETVQAIQATASDLALEMAGDDTPPVILESITEFIGGGGPRFWFSVTPEQQQLNYAQIVIQVRHKEDTRRLLPLLQERLSTGVAGARIDVRELETGKPIGIPVSIRLAGDNAVELRRIAERTKQLLRELPGARRVRDDWGGDTFAVRLEVDPDRANLAGVSNFDVALSSASSLSGYRVGQLRDGDRQIDIVSRLRSDERAQLADLESLYVNSTRGPRTVPLGQVSRVTYALQPEKIRRRNQFRTITVSCFPAAGMLPSEIIGAALPALDALRATLPPGYTLEVGGELEEQVKSFRSLVLVLALLIASIYAALVVQFQNAVKPMVVFVTLPYGAAAALTSLVVMGAPFSFMAFLGIISLMGVIVSHIIVLFDFIEEMQERGEPLRDALLDAGLLRLRPVLVTVGATVLGLVPLALHGGPLWQPLCYAQIGGLTAATVLTLLLVPVVFTIAVEDLGWICWEAPMRTPSDAGASPRAGEADASG